MRLSGAMQRALGSKLNRLVIISALSGCAPGANPQTLRVTGVQLGRSLNADKAVAENASSFRSHDKVSVSVLVSA